MKKQLLAMAVVSVLIAPQVSFAAGSGTESSYGNSTDTTNVEGSYEYKKAVRSNANGQYETAISLLKQVVAADPKDADAWNELGFAYRNVKQYALSATAYDAALELDPDHLGALNYQGFMFLETDQAAKAQANANKLKMLCGDCEEYLTLAAKL